MPRFFFDIHDRVFTRDDEGVDLPNVEAVRKEAMRVLPQIAADEIPQDGDHRHFTVIVSDENGKALYTAALTYTGFWLQR